jgi:ABC-type siderophore export system fused ATPase/permease subunit
MFAIAFTLYAICFRRTSHRLTVILEGILTQLRVRIAEKIRHADLLSLESIEQAEIYNLVTSEAQVISEASGVLAAALQSSMLLTFGDESHPCAIRHQSQAFHMKRGEHRAGCDANVSGVGKTAARECVAVIAS